MANSVIPEEIMTDILKRLPVKSLKRFECVSPAWRSLLKSPFFRNTHLKHQKLLKIKNESSSKEDEYALVLSSYPTEVGNAQFSFYRRGGNAGELVPMQTPNSFLVFPHNWLEICAPCNGIFCVVATNDDSAIYLCNPATCESRRLPERPFGFQPSKFPGSSVSYVKRKAWGFGVDSRTDEYKVVSIMYYGTVGDRYCFDLTDDSYDEALAMNSDSIILNHGIIQVEVYDLGSDTWREVEVVLPDDVFGLVKRNEKLGYVYSLEHWWGNGLFLNGCIHWLYDVIVEEAILSFDISSETMRAFEVPFSRDTLMVLGDSLAMMVQSDGVENSPISVWVMEEYGVKESWVKRFSLAPSPIPVHFLFSWKDGDGDLLLFHASDPDTETLASCNTSGGGYHTYPIRTKKTPYMHMRVIVVSEQSLVSVDIKN